MARLAVTHGGWRDAQRMPTSNKTPIIEELFNKRWVGRGKALRNSQVTLAEVQDAFRRQNSVNPRKQLSTKNPANFFKDFIRKRRSANANWPRSVFDRGYTAAQTTGAGLCFEFVPLAPGQREPFPGYGLSLSADAPIHQVQSASMPLASRRLGRTDEAWLIQVLVRLHVVETHLALYSKVRFLQVDLLQTNVKLAKAEIDALFLGHATSGPNEGEQTQEAIITCEAKGLGDDILLDQVLAQVKAAFGMRGMIHDLIIPLAAKVIGPSRVHIVQFAPVARDQAARLPRLTIESEAVYEFVPAVAGIGK